MIFNLKLESSVKVSRYNENSAIINFCKDNSEFEKCLELNKAQITSLQKKNFLKDENSELMIWDLGNPALRILKKTDLNKKFNVDYFRNYLSGLTVSLEKLNIASLYIEIPNYEPYNNIFNDEKYFYQSIVEGILLGNYNFNIYKSDSKKAKNLKVTFISPKKKVFESAMSIAQSVISGVFFTRDLINEPANTLTPQKLAENVKKEFRRTTVKVSVFDEKELIKRKMNAIISVGKGSDNKPKLIIAHYKPKSKSIKKIALVGKGVTYDTGGLSIKPTSGMLDMKADMSGGGVVFGIIKVVEKLKLPIELIGIVPAVENAINGNAYKPGDVISTASGKTIEVKDTDAEGRIVLADALEYACKQKPDQIIDFATLTGAAVVALGEMAAAVFTKNDKMSSNIVEASKVTYEHAWPMPFWDEYNKLLESKIADVSNLGPRWGGAITAGKFLEHFVDEKIPWTHIDIAGPSLKHDLTNYTKDYCTGYGVRLITRYLELLK